MNKDIEEYKNFRKEQLEENLQRSFEEGKVKSLLRQENTNLKQAINEIREYIDKHKLDNRYNFKSLIYADDILQIIDKVGGNE